MYVQFKNLFPKIAGLILRLCLLIVVVASPMFVIASHFDALEPYLFPLHFMQESIRNPSKNILLGHYPSLELLNKLNTGSAIIVISLLNNKLIYEESLNQKESNYTKRLGIKKYDFQMDSAQPVENEINETAIENIRKVIRSNPKSKIYIHCYLGKHRTKYVEDALFPVAKIVTFAKHSMR